MSSCWNAFTFRESDYDGDCSISFDSRIWAFFLAGSDTACRLGPSSSDWESCTRASVMPCHVFPAPQIGFMETRIGGKRRSSPAGHPSVADGVCPLLVESLPACRKHHCVWTLISPSYLYIFLGSIFVGFRVPILLHSGHDGAGLHINTTHPSQKKKPRFGGKNWNFPFWLFPPCRWKRAGPFLSIFVFCKI